MLYVKCLCWSLGHAEQLLFSCVSSKVSICNYVTCHICMSHVICQMLMLILETCWTIFVFMSMLKCCCWWKVQWLFFDTTSSTLACEWTNHRAGSQLKISHFFSPLPRINLMQSNWLGQLSQAGGCNGGMCWSVEEIEPLRWGPFWPCTKRFSMILT